MAGFSLATLTARARKRADMLGSPFMEDTDIAEIINEAWSELYDLLVTTYEDYFVLSETFPTVSGTDEYNLATLLTKKPYKLRGVDLVVAPAAGNIVTLEPFSWSERERYSGTGPGISAYTQSGERMKYCRKDEKLVLAPVPDGAYTIKVHYVPGVTLLDNSVPGTSDVLPSQVQNGWERYIVFETVIQMLAQQDRESSFIESRKQKVADAIVGAAVNRDAEGAPRMTRVADSRFRFGSAGDDEDLG